MRYLVLTNSNDVWVIGPSGDDLAEIGARQDALKVPSILIDTEEHDVIEAIDCDPTLEVQTENSIYRFDEERHTYIRADRASPDITDAIEPYDYIEPDPFSNRSKSLFIHRECPTCGDRTHLVTSDVVRFIDLRTSA